MNINWYPGHMARSLRELGEKLDQVDLVIETCDARLPESSRNPEIRALIERKPVILVLTKADLADPDCTADWLAWYREENVTALEVAIPERSGLGRLVDAIQKSGEDVVARARSRGLQARAIRAMVVGIPNTGKSSLINQLAGRRVARIENRPGVTRAPAWVRTSSGITLMDMPGILWPNLGSERQRLILAASGAIRDDILNREEIAFATFCLLRERYPALLAERFRLTAEALADNTEDPYVLYEKAARRRGAVLSGGRIDTDRFARLLITELRDGRIGRISLETVSDRALP
ncbi:MAG: ribosome biogenesis GTPase YlqF [Bacillota bacterium]|nr:ribosome biogenesis GTPase YlqF [Bacillota bacterium]